MEVNFSFNPFVVSCQLGQRNKWCFGACASRLKTWAHNPEKNKRSLSPSQHNQALRYTAEI